jgi:hypothetical protein
MTEARQVVAVVTAFIKSNENSLECRVGAYQSNRKIHPTFCYTDYESGTAAFMYQTLIRKKGRSISTFIRMYMYEVLCLKKFKTLDWIHLAQDNAQAQSTAIILRNQ